ncbi:RHS repeat-associated core domain-containing protein [Pseudomonas sp. GM60]|uniref:RHS repeat-associated core domain-containing protein n=1 Tax=Pseudomonas sp. GM60 TaxID=1144334 RepID=UPI000270AD52|nr:RHS repeat-associated core domain-containing protein [Pseudomonas sp. GM60]EJM87665.1 RHS repeat-associated core domain protein-containing protein [Pseudomonas sp. GM60]
MQSPCETELCQYHYDALDQLIANVVPCKPLHKRFYCKSHLATEIQGANRYSMFQHGDQLLAQQQSEGDAPDATLLATDQQRSVLHTLKANHPRQPIAYTPYGHHRPGNGLLSLLGFNGERPDPVTGHYLLGNGYRAFNPILMRFNSPDNWSPFGRGGLNSYAYCLGDPTNRRDPSGHNGLLAFVKAHISQGNSIDTFLKRPTMVMQNHNPAKQALKAELAEIKLLIESPDQPKKGTPAQRNELDKIFKKVMFETTLTLEEHTLLRNPPNIPGHIPTLQKLSHDAVSRLPSSLQQDPSLQTPKIELSKEFKKHVWEIVKQGEYNDSETRTIIRNTYIDAASGRIRGIDPTRLTQQ